MGNSIWMRSSNPAIDEAYCESTDNILALSLDQAYNNFASGYEAIGEDCDFAQIQEIFGIDLSPFRVFNEAGIHMAMCQGDLDWELSKVATEQEKDEVRASFTAKLEEAQRKDAEAFERDWVEMKVLAETIRQLQKKIITRPDLLDEVDFKIMDKANFLSDKGAIKTLAAEDLKRELSDLDSEKTEREFQQVIRAMGDFMLNDEAAQAELRKTLLERKRTFLEEELYAIENQHSSPRKYNINTDFQKMLDFINYATAHGENKIAFYIE